MTLSLSILVAAVVLALVLLVARVARTHHPRETWVCKWCGAAFSSEGRAHDHLVAAHDITP